MNVALQIVLSPNASDLVRRFGASPALGQAISLTLDKVNEDTLNLIRQRLNVAGNSKRGKAESASRDYPYPHKVTSRLQNSMGKTLSIIDGTGRGMSVRSTIGSGASSGKEAVRYAAIQEYGGVVNVPSRERKSENPKYLRAHPGPTKAYSYTVRARSYLRSSVFERKQVYSRLLSRTVKNFYGGQN